MESKFKKAFFAIALLLCMTAATQAQTAQQPASRTLTTASSSTATTEAELTKTATKTGEQYEVPSTGDKYDVWQSRKGSIFIIRKSAKTGNYYKQYLKVKD